MRYGPVSAKVNNKVEGMHYRVYNNKDVEFLDLYSASGSRAYTRTLFFVLCKAVHDIFPKGSVVIDIPVSNGYYCDLQIGRAVTLQDVDILRTRMQEIIDRALPIHRHEATTEEATEMFRKLGTHSKVTLLKTIGNIYTTYYEIDGYVDYFYGTMLTNTSQLYLQVAVVSVAHGDPRSCISSDWRSITTDCCCAYLRQTTRRSWAR